MPFDSANCLTPSANSRHEVRQALLGDRGFRAGRHMNDAVPETQFVNHVRHVLVLRPGEYVDMDAHPAQFTRQVAHVDVHPAGVLAPQDGQRARVIRDHGNIHEITHKASLHVSVHHVMTGRNSDPTASDGQLPCRTSQIDDPMSRKLASLWLSPYNPRAPQATVAQPVEQTIRNRQVKGSIPFGGSTESRVFHSYYRLFRKEKPHVFHRFP